MPRLGGPKMWDHVNRPPVGLSLLFQYHSCQGPCTRWHSLSPREKMFQFSHGGKKKKKEGKKTPNIRHRGSGSFQLWQTPRKAKEKGVPKKKKKRKPALFSCGTSIKASKWGRLGGTLAHQTDTPNTHHLYAGLLKKRKIKVSADEKRPVPCIYTPPPPIHPLPLFFFFLLN